LVESTFGGVMASRGALVVIGIGGTVGVGTVREELGTVSVGTVVEFTDGGEKATAMRTASAATTDIERN
jgi:hypothetical protein